VDSAAPHGGAGNARQQTDLAVLAAEGDEILPKQPDPLRPGLDRFAGGERDPVFSRISRPIGASRSPRQPFIVETRDHADS